MRYITTLLFILLFMVIVVPPSEAATLSELQAQIDAAKAQVETLQQTILGQHSITSPVPSDASSSFCISFARDLNIGSTGDDVRQLQKLLNTSPDTRITEAGPGSPGNETTYYGALTADAVTRFQNKYHTEVLRPLSLSFGTGYFGSLTRKKAGQIAVEKCASFSTAPPTDNDDQEDTSTPTDNSNSDLFASTPVMSVPNVSFSHLPESTYTFDTLFVEIFGTNAVFDDVKEYIEDNYDTSVVVGSQSAIEFTNNVLLSPAIQERIEEALDVFVE